MSSKFNDAVAALHARPAQRSADDLDAMASCLAELPFFAGVDPGILQQICAVLGLQVAAPGEAVLHVGELTDRMYILLRGRCSLIRHSRKEGLSPQPVQILEPGQVFCEAALVVSGRRSDLEVTVLEAAEAAESEAEATEAVEGVDGGEAQTTVVSTEAASGSDGGDAGGGGKGRACFAVLTRNAWNGLSARANTQPLFAQASLVLLCCAARSLVVASSEPGSRTLEQREDLCAVLRLLPPLSSAPAAVLRSVCESAVLRCLPPGTVLFEEATRPEAQFLVLGGEVQVRSTKKHNAKGARGASRTASPGHRLHHHDTPRSRAASLASATAGFGATTPQVSESGAERSPPPPRVKSVQEKVEEERKERDALQESLALSHGTGQDRGDSESPTSHRKPQPPSGGHTNKWMLEFIGRIRRKVASAGGGSSSSSPSSPTAASAAGDGPHVLRDPMILGLTPTPPSATGASSYVVGAGTDGGAGGGDGDGSSAAASRPASRAVSTWHNAVSRLKQGSALGRRQAAAAGSSGARAGSAMDSEATSPRGSIADGAEAAVILEYERRKMEEAGGAANVGDLLGGFGAATAYVRGIEDAREGLRQRQGFGYGEEEAGQQGSELQEGPGGDGIGGDADTGAAARPTDVGAAGPDPRVSTTFLGKRFRVPAELVSFFSAVEGLVRGASDRQDSAADEPRTPKGTTDHPHASCTAAHGAAGADGPGRHHHKNLTSGPGHAHGGWQGGSGPTAGRPSVPPIALGGAAGGASLGSHGDAGPKASSADEQDEVAALELCEAQLERLFGPSTGRVETGQLAGEVAPPPGQGGMAAWTHLRRSETAIAGPSGAALLVMPLASLQRGHEAVREELVAERGGALALVEPFRGLKRKAATALALEAEVMTVDANQIIVRQGQPVDALYVVLDGEVRLLDDPEGAAAVAAAEAAAAAVDGGGRGNGSPTRGSGSSGGGAATASTASSAAAAAVAASTASSGIRARRAAATLSALTLLGPGGSFGESVLGYSANKEQGRRAGAAARGQARRDGNGALSDTESDSDNEVGGFALGASRSMYDAARGRAAGGAAPPAATRHLATAIAAKASRVLVIRAPMLSRYRALRASLPSFAASRREALAARRQQLQQTVRSMQSGGGGAAAAGSGMEPSPGATRAVAAARAPVVLSLAPSTPALASPSAASGGSGGGGEDEVGRGLNGSPSLPSPRPPLPRSTELLEQMAFKGLGNPRTASLFGGSAGGGGLTPMPSERISRLGVLLSGTTGLPTGPSSDTQARTLSQAQSVDASTSQQETSGAVTANATAASSDGAAAAASDGPDGSPARPALPLPAAAVMSAQYNQMSRGELDVLAAASGNDASWAAVGAAAVAGGRAPPKPRVLRRSLSGNRTTVSQLAAPPSAGVSVTSQMAAAACPTGSNGNRPTPSPLAASSAGSFGLGADIPSPRPPPGSIVGGSSLRGAAFLTRLGSTERRTSTTGLRPSLTLQVEALGEPDGGTRDSDAGGSGGGAGAGGGGMAAGGGAAARQPSPGPLRGSGSVAMSPRGSAYRGQQQGSPLPLLAVPSAGTASSGGAASPLIRPAVPTAGSAGASPRGGGGGGVGDYRMRASYTGGGGASYMAAFGDGGGGSAIAGPAVIGGMRAPSPAPVLADEWVGGGGGGVANGGVSPLPPSPAPSTPRFRLSNSPLIASRSRTPGPGDWPTESPQGAATGTPRVPTGRFSGSGSAAAAAPAAAAVGGGGAGASAAPVRATRMPARASWDGSYARQVLLRSGAGDGPAPSSAVAGGGGGGVAASGGAAAPGGGLLGAAAAAPAAGLAMAVLAGVPQAQRQQFQQEVQKQHAKQVVKARADRYRFGG